MLGRYLQHPHHQRCGRIQGTVRPAAPSQDAAAFWNAGRASRRF